VVTITDYNTVEESWFALSANSTRNCPQLYTVLKKAIFLIADFASERFEVVKSGVDEDWSLQGCYAVAIGKWLQI
jgi:hypothetical protein